MDSLTFTIDTSELDNADFNQLANDIQTFINILHCTSHDCTIVCSILQKQLDEQVKKHKEETDPVERMREKFYDIFDEAGFSFTFWDMNGRHGDEPVPGFFDAWDNFFAQIGEAMGPMCYAAWRLSAVFHQAGFNTDWINTCVSYYESNWKF